MGAVKKSVSLPDELWAGAEDRARALGYSTMSAYLQHLVRADLLRREAHVRSEAIHETPTPYNVTPAAPAPMSQLEQEAVERIKTAAVRHLGKKKKAG